MVLCLWKHGKHVQIILEDLDLDRDPGDLIREISGMLKDDE